MGMKHKTIINGKVFQAIGKTSNLDGGQYISVDENGTEHISVTKEDYINIINNYIDKCFTKGVRRLDFTVSVKNEVLTYSVKPSVLRDYEKAKYLYRYNTSNGFLSLCFRATTKNIKLLQEIGELVNENELDEFEDIEGSNNGYKAEVNLYGKACKSQSLVDGTYINNEGIKVASQLKASVNNFRKGRNNGRGKAHDIWTIKAGMVEEK